jgi:putative transport protein
MKARGMTGVRYIVTSAPEAAAEIQSVVPRIGVFVGYAMSGIVPTVFGYFAMLLAP